MIADRIKEKAADIDAVIDIFLPAEEGMAATVMTAMNYSIHVGGKRLRPMLMEETYRMFGGGSDRIIQSLVRPWGYSRVTDF